MCRFGDDQIRCNGSSGGAATALSLHALESGSADFVLNTKASENEPHINQTVFCRNRKDLMSTTGSRYAPASPCDGLSAAKASGERFVFVGKPCDVAATRKISQRDPELLDQLALSIAFFCAGTPSTKGTLRLLESMDVSDLSTLKSLRYRGNGWPGKATAITEGPDETAIERSQTYEESWGRLTKYVQWRCRVCLDHTGEFSDIAVGDPWYRTPRDGSQISCTQEAMSGVGC